METKIIKYTDNIYAIDQQMVRAFVILGESSALVIDTGATPADIHKLIGEITPLPYELCLTHSDGDHTANMANFKKVYAGVAEVPYIAQKAEELGIEVIPVNEGHVFDLGGVQIQAVAMPGHTPGSTGYLYKNEGILFSGDTVSYGPVYMFGGNRDFAAFEESLKKLKVMAEKGEFKIIYPCHNTCPITPEVIDALSECAAGIKEGSIEGKEAKMPFKSENAPKLYEYKNCGILYI
ncbi:MAG: MBL fold metallo-hydrolase [Eubacteriaceae bacterium]|nr:MBL fold metallo-hydrolase [Eubacteriaceae bacterium]